MQYIQFIFALVILFSLIIFIFIYFNSILNSFIYKVPQVGTFKSDFKVMKKGLKKYNLEGKKLVDLGSGTGKVLRFFETEYKMGTTGYEIDLGNVIISRFLNKILGKNTKVIKKNYFEVNLNNFDCIYIYLYPCLIDKIEEKIWKEAKKGTIIISNAFKFKNHKPSEILINMKGIEEVYIYEIQ